MSSSSRLGLAFARIGRSVGRLRVGHQLLCAFGAILVLTSLLGAASLFELRLVNQQADKLANKWLAGVGELADTRARVIETREFELKHSRTSDGSYHAEYEDKMAQAEQAVSDLLASYRARVQGDEEAALVAQFDKSWGEYRGFRQRVIKFGRDGDQQDAADIADGASSMAFDESVTNLSELLAFNQAGGKAAAQSAETAYGEGLLAITVLLAGAVLVGVTLALLITRSLVGRLGGEPQAAVDVARAVAEGDLTTAIHVRPGDTDSLMAWLQKMQRGLEDAVQNVRQGSEFVASASMQIAQGNQDLSSRTEKQASALQQTAATMEELGSTVRHNADNARQASQLAQSASGVARQGGEVVGEVVETMKGINDSSRKIADIIGVIDGIAFQTNILALNAAVEAARAGEQGRGFAVVAGEVRSLAQRSAEAAKEIKGLITASVERVEHGSTLVDRAGQTMGEIVTAIGRVTDIVGEISAASVEQSSGVSQVGQAVSDMDRTTQQNAALVEQSAAAAESLRQQAQQLVQAVAVFKTASGSTPVRSVAAPAVKPTAAVVARPTTTPAPKATPPAAKPASAAAEKEAPKRPVRPVRQAKPAQPAVLAQAPAAAVAVAAAGAADDDWQSF